jgi:hypothetical protein
MRQAAQSVTPPCGAVTCLPHDPLLPQAAPADGLTPYERERLQLIARNRERMAALQLPQMAADFAAIVAPPKPARAAATQKGVGAASRKRARAAAGLELPPRSSGRLRGVAPDAATAGGIVHEGRDGRVVVAAAPAGGGDNGGGARAGAAPKAEPAPRFSEGARPRDAYVLMRVGLTNAVIAAHLRVGWWLNGIAMAAASS